MRGVIKGVLAEELGNSLRMARGYQAALGKLPQGCLAAREIKGRRYYYLVTRAGKKVKYIYRGKMAAGEIKKYQQAKLLRAKYRGLLSQVKKQIRFLRSSLRGKETV